MTLREQYSALLKTARRQFGQLKRYAIPSRSGYVPSFEDFYLTREPGDRITKRDIKDLQRQIDFAKENATQWRANEEDEENGKQAIENLKTALSKKKEKAKTTKGQIVAEKASNILTDIIEKAEKKYKNRYAIMYDKIQNWASDFMERLEKMVLVLYSKEYDGGTDDLNLIQWQVDIVEFAKTLDVDADAVLIDLFESEIDDKRKSKK